MKYIELIVGTSDFVMYFAQWTFAILGIAVSLLIDAKNRDKGSDRTPFIWSWNFFWSDNFKRLLLTILLVFVALRFSNQLLGVDISLWSALLIGLGFDKLAEIAKKKNIFGDK